MLTSIHCVNYTTARGTPPSRWVAPPLAHNQQTTAVERTGRPLRGKHREPPQAALEDKHKTKPPGVTVVTKLVQ